jgi:hypothetical protein
MPALGILTCEILELEFAHLLVSDPEIQRVTVVEEEYSQTLTALLEESGPRPRQIKRSKDFDRNAGNGLEVLIRVLELGLHHRKRLLQEGLAAAGKEMGPGVDALLLGYGLCGNALPFLNTASPITESGTATATCTRAISAWNPKSRFTTAWNSTIVSVIPTWPVIWPFWPWTWIFMAIPS